MKKLIRKIDCFLDKHFRNDYKLRVRVGDLIRDGEERFCVLKVFNQKECECKSIKTGEVKIISIQSIQPVTVYKCWARWEVKEAMKVAFFFYC